LQEAQKQKRPIFVDVYAEWCGPCKMLERNTFPNPDLGAYVAKYYIAYPWMARRAKVLELPINTA
jgi:thiol:disulfide interchange protein